MEFLLEFKNIIVTTFLSLGTGFTTFIFTKRMYNTQVESKRIDNISALSKTYRDLLDDLEIRHKKQIDSLYEEIRIYKSREIEFRNELDSLRNYVISLENKISKINSSGSSRRPTRRK
jgi:uncharacterized coiled-coil DUF342 family protein